MRFQSVIALTSVVCLSGYSPMFAQTATFAELAATGSNLAQVPSSIPPGSLEPTRPPLPSLPNAPASPDLPSLTSPMPASPETPENVPAATVFVRQIEVLGNTVFSEAEISEVIKPFENRSLTFEELLSIRTAITELYTRQGYTTSGAFLPPQDVSDGIVQIQVVEGELERIEIQGLTRLKESYIRSRIALAANPPINLRQLESALQLLQLDPHISRIQAELTAGTSSGRNILTLQVKEAENLAGLLVVDNRDSPSVGSIRYTAGISHNNILGFGDTFSVEAGLTEGITNYNFNYAIPLNPRDGTLSLNYSNSSSRIIEDPFEALDIKGNSQSASIRFRQPITRSPNHEFALGLTADWRQSRTFLYDDIPFSFSEGPEKGESKVAVIRFSQDWVDRTRTRVLAARSEFSLGLGILGATVNDTGTDGRFVSWVGQFQWVQDLGNDTIAIARIATQLTPDSLLPLEQFSIGGIDTVRGYRQNQRVADNGIVGSLEVRFPLVQKPEGIGTLQLAPFFDIGTVWNNNDDSGSATTLMGVGVGLRWRLNQISARLDWGIPLLDVEDQGSSLQDDGLYFSVQWQPF